MLVVAEALVCACDNPDADGLSFGAVCVKEAGVGELLVRVCDLPCEVVSVLDAGVAS